MTRITRFPITLFCDELLNDSYHRLAQSAALLKTVWKNITDKRKCNFVRWSSVQLASLQRKEMCIEIPSAHSICSIKYLYSKYALIFTDRCYWTCRLIRKYVNQKQLIMCVCLLFQNLCCHLRLFIKVALQILFWIFWFSNWNWC